MMMKGEFNKRPPKNKGMAMMMENFPRGELYIWKEMTMMMENFPIGELEHPAGCNKVWMR